MISVSEPWFIEDDSERVAECVRTGWVSSAGPAVQAFETAWARYCGRQHGIAVSSGTAALQLPIAALDLQPGDEVILPTFTIISCALAILYGGGTPVLVDSDPATWCMDVGQDRSENHAPHARHHARPHLRPSRGYGSAAWTLPQRHGPHGDRRRGRSARRRVLQPRPLAPLRKFRRDELLQLLRQQADRHRRRRHDRHR